MINLYGTYRNKTFADIWEEASDFVSEYDESPLAPGNNRITDTSAEVLYYLLYARYGNSVILADDENRFKYRLFSIIYQYGPTWEKRITIQKELRELTADDLKSGGFQIYNQADNPNLEPATDTTEPLPYVSHQTTSKRELATAHAYGLLWELLNTDVTNNFLTKFKVLFTIFPAEKPLLYETEVID